VDPEAPLARGYGLVRVAGTGAAFAQRGRGRAGQELDIRVADGAVGARVLEVRPGPGAPEEPNAPGGERA
jgi:exodeoxyribonuclease VII large subunit